MRKKQDNLPRNDKGQPHGLWIWYRDDGNVLFKRRYVNGIEHGISEEYLSNGDLFYKRYWINKGKYLYCELYKDDNEIEFNI